MNPSVGDRPEKGVSHPRSSRHKQSFFSEVKGQMGRPSHRGRCRYHQVLGDTLAVLSIPGSLKGRYKVTLKPWHSLLYTKTFNMAPRAGIWEYSLATKYILLDITHCGVVVGRMETVIKDSYVGTSLVVQWLKDSTLPMQEAWVQSLGRELRSPMLSGQKKKKKIPM